MDNANLDFEFFEPMIPCEDEEKSGYDLRNKRNNCRPADSYESPDYGYDYE